MYLNKFVMFFFFCSLNLRICKWLLSLIIICNKDMTFWKKKNYLSFFLKPLLCRVPIILETIIQPIYDVESYFLPQNVCKIFNIFCCRRVVEGGMGGEEMSISLSFSLSVMNVQYVQYTAQSTTHFGFMIVWTTIWKPDIFNLFV